MNWKCWNLMPIFTQKWASVDMKWGVQPPPQPRKFQPCVNFEATDTCHQTNCQKSNNCCTQIGCVLSIPHLGPTELMYCNLIIVQGHCSVNEQFLFVAERICGAGEVQSEGVTEWLWLSRVMISLWTCITISDYMAAYSDAHPLYHTNRILMKGGTWAARTQYSEPKYMLTNSKLADNKFIYILYFGLRQHSGRCDRAADHNKTCSVIHFTAVTDNHWFSSEVA